jgi:hypothetical protein
LATAGSVLAAVPAVRLDLVRATRGGFLLAWLGVVWAANCDALGSYSDPLTPANSGYTAAFGIGSNA